MKDCEHGVPFWGICNQCTTIPNSKNSIPEMTADKLEETVDTIKKRYAILYNSPVDISEFSCFICGETLLEKEPHKCKDWEALLVNIS